jgi:dihydroorotase
MVQTQGDAMVGSGTAAYDLAIRGAHLLDAATGRDGVADVALRGSRIDAIGDLGDVAATTDVIDGRGCLLSAGWIDLHVHCFVGHHELAIDADDACGVHAGVTTVVDTGSFTSSEIDVFREIAERAATRVLGYVNVSAYPGRPVHGDWQRFDQRLTIATAAAHRDLVVGIKVLASQAHVGAMGFEPVDLAVQAAREAETGLMVHLGMAPPTVGRVLDALDRGDVVTHCCKGYPRGIMNRHGRPVPQAWAALERGVLFDTGHGQDSYTFAAHRQARSAGFPIHTLSTDLHSGNLHGPVHSLALTMAKALHLGATLPEVVEQVTRAPARALGRDAELGVLAVGREADLTLFRVRDEATPVRDAEGNEETAARRIEVVQTIRAGRAYAARAPEAAAC